MSRENTVNSSNVDPQGGGEDASRAAGMLGDPNCPLCAGVGVVRRDLPVGHPDFGRLLICSCRQLEVTASERQRMLRISNLDAFRGMTFDTFKVQGRSGLGDQQARSLQFAFQQAQQYARALAGWFFIMGPYGCGKTHLAAAIANSVIEMGVGVIFLTVPDLLDWLRASFSSPDETFEQRLDEIRNVRLLVLDDLGTQNATPWAEEKLYQIINYRYTHRLPTVVTTNLPLAEIDGRVASRLQDADLVSRAQIVAPDYRSPVVDSERSSISALSLLAEQTFGTFNLREWDKLALDDQASLQKAFNAAVTFAENPRGWLVLMGDYGCGKTHLAAAIGNFRKAAGEEPIFVVVPDLLDHLRAAFSPSSAVSYDRRFEEVRSASLLILDDLGTQSATPWAREKLYQLLNHRYNGKLPTVITTAQSLDEVDPRIRSRMMDRRVCSIYAITAPPFVSRSEAQPRRKPAPRRGR